MKFIYKGNTKFAEEFFFTFNIHGDTVMRKFLEKTVLPPYFPLLSFAVRYDSVLKSRCFPFIQLERVYLPSIEWTIDFFFFPFIANKVLAIELTQSSFAEPARQQK